MALALSGGIAFALTRPDTPQDLPVAETSAPHSAIVVPERGFDTSRNAPRPTLKPTPTAKPSIKPAPKAKPTPTPGRAAATVKPSAPPKAVDTKFVTVNLNVRLAPLETASLLTVLSAGTKVSVTGKEDGEWAQIVKDGKALWVKSEYLADKMPPPEEDKNTGGGISAAPCSSGSDVEDGLRPDTIRVHRAVCALFPSVSSYGGLRSGDGGEHGVGRALDIMITGSTGDEIAAYVRSHAKELGVSEVIWEQRIWTVERSGDGWRPMEDRGGATANHFDHVHVTTYGDSGSS